MQRNPSFSARSVLFTLAWSLAACLFLAVVFSLQNGLAYVGAGQDPQWKLLFLGELPGWLAWVVLAPLIAFTVKKLPFRGPAKWWHVVALAALGVLIVAFRLVLTYVIAFPIVGDLFTLSFTEYVGSRFQRSFIILYMVYAGFVLVFQLIEYNTESRRRERHMRGLESSLLEARLNMLRTQLQPHFLFNTMNSIAAMINSDPDGARSMVHRLSALLRTSLDETAGHTISLNEEIALLREYLEIQQIRFADRFSYSIEIPPGLHHEEVPRFLLQPIVENAIKFSAQIPG